MKHKMYSWIMIEFKMINVGTLTIKIKDFDARHNATFPSDFIIGSQFGFNTILEYSKSMVKISVGM